MKHSTLALALTALLVLSGPFALAQSLDDSGGGAVEFSDSQPVQSAATTGRTVRTTTTTTTTGNTATRNTDKPLVGRNAAAKYMGTHNSPDRSPAAAGAGLGSEDHYLALHFGGYVSDNAYRWGAKDNATNVGQSNIGVTYRIGEWRNSMDLAVRVDYSGYSLTEGKAAKLAFLPVITFPDASSRFPLYFGIGAGLGVFMNQVAGESALALDYQLLLGARFFEIFQNTGFFIEAGIKNHLFLLSDGQFNGTFAALGPVFTF